MVTPQIPLYLYEKLTRNLRGFVRVAAIFRECVTETGNLNSLAFAPYQLTYNSFLIISHAFDNLR